MKLHTFAVQSLALQFLTVSLYPTSHAQTSTASITPEELRAHVKFLASDELEGRGSGTQGNEQAAAYIARQFENYGLSPAGDSGTYFQTFTFVSAVRLGTGNSLALTGPGHVTTGLTPEVDFRPLGFSSNGAVSGGLVFVGYGISAPESGYDDYSNVEVTGKLVVAMRYGPDGNDLHSDLYKHTSFRNKARMAREKGAAGLILITGPNDEPTDELVRLSYDNSFASSGIPAISMKRLPVEQALGRLHMDLKSVQDSIKANRRPLSAELQGVSATLVTDVVQIKATTANIVGYLQGSAPDLKEQAVVVGAHMDHLGFGGAGSGSLLPDVHEIHNGADDNASGAAGLLELAEAFAAKKSSLARSLVFIAFSGEEMGTLGSSHYVNHPFVPLAQTAAMVNMDMIGKLRKDELTIYGTGTSPIWDEVLSKADPDSLFSIKKVPDGFGPSDHSQFYAKDIPVLFFFTGTHDDYHKPSDDWDKLNYQGEVTVLQFVSRVITDLSHGQDRPAFARTQTSSTMGGGDSRGFNVTLGVIPDYGEGSEGMKIGGIRPSGPAEKAGMKAGDIITRMAGKKVLNIYDYMGILGELKAGQEIDVDVVRDGKTLTLHATMEKRK
jgi:hypothetical protein